MTSSASITCLAPLGNVRTVGDRGKTLLFDSNLYLADNESLSVVFRYFNLDDVEFSESGIQTFIIRATVTKLPKDPVEVVKEGEVLRDTEYDLMGDIVWLIPVTTHDLKQRPYIDLCGTAKDIIERDACFDIDADQYTQLLKKKSVFPARCIIPDSPKYSKGLSKPIPKPNGNVVVSGALTRILPDANDDEGRPSKFYVSVDAVTFMGKNVNSPVKAKQPTEPARTQGKRKQLIDFSNPSLDLTESPPPKKIKLESSSSSAGTSGEGGPRTRSGNSR